MGVGPLSVVRELEVDVKWGCVEALKSEVSQYVATVNSVCW